MSTVPIRCPACRATSQIQPPVGRQKPFCPECGAVLPESAVRRAGYYYGRNGERRGPVSLEELRRLAQTGELRGTDMVLPAGARTWAEAATLPGLHWPPAATPSPAAQRVPGAGASAPVDSSVRLPQAPPVSASTGRSFWARLHNFAQGPWNPTPVFVVGIFMGVPWLGLLAAANAARLGQGLHWWRPAGAATAALVLGVVGELWKPFWIPALLLQAGLLILLWVYEFGAQRRAYGKWQSEGERPGSWLTPVVAGVALVTFYVVVGAASAPLTARQVCERFAQACKDGDGAAMKTYADPYLHFAIDALTRLESDGRNSDFAVLAEGADQLGTFVNFRRSFRLAGEHHVLTGYFDLVPYQGSWRVKDLVYDRLGPDGKIQPYHVATGYTKLDEQERQGKLAPVPLPPSGTSARSGSTTGSASGASLFSDLGQKILVSVLSAIALAVGKYSWTLWRSAQSKAGGAPAS